MNVDETRLPNHFFFNIPEGELLGFSLRISLSQFRLRRSSPQILIQDDERTRTERKMHKPHGPCAQYLVEMVLCHRSNKVSFQRVKKIVFSNILVKAIITAS